MAYTPISWKSVTGIDAGDTLQALNQANKQLVASFKDTGGALQKYVKDDAIQTSQDAVAALSASGTPLEYMAARDKFLGSEQNLDRATFMKGYDQVLKQDAADDLVKADIYQRKRLQTQLDNQGTRVGDLRALLGPDKLYGDISIDNIGRVNVGTSTVAQQDDFQKVLQERDLGPLATSRDIKNDLRKYTESLGMTSAQSTEFEDAIDATLAKRNQLSLTNSKAHETFKAKETRLRNAKNAQRQLEYNRKSAGYTPTPVQNSMSLVQSMDEVTSLVNERFNEPTFSWGLTGDQLHAKVTEAEAANHPPGVIKAALNRSDAGGSNFFKPTVNEGNFNHYLKHFQKEFDKGEVKKEAMQKLEDEFNAKNFDAETQFSANIANNLLDHQSAEGIATGEARNRFLTNARTRASVAPPVEAPVAPPEGKTPGASEKPPTNSNFTKPPSRNIGDNSEILIPTDEPDVPPTPTDELSRVQRQFFGVNHLLNKGLLGKGAFDEIINNWRQELRETAELPNDLGNVLNKFINQPLLNTADLAANTASNLANLSTRAGKALLYGREGQSPSREAELLTNALTRASGDNSGIPTPTLAEPVASDGTLTPDENARFQLIQDLVARDNTSATSANTAIAEASSTDNLPTEPVIDSFTGASAIQQTVANVEGTSLTTYKDTAGHSTIGVGHKLTAKELLSDTITIAGSSVDISNGISKEDSSKLFIQDWEKNAKLVSSKWDDFENLLGIEQDLLTEIQFNTGNASPSKWPNLAKALKLPDSIEKRAAVARELGRTYTDSKGKKVPLTNRVKRLIQTYLSN